MSDNEIESSVITCEPEEGELTNMFASVWVKVEVQADAQADVDTPSHTPKPRKSKKKKGKEELACQHCDYTTIHKNCLRYHIHGHDNKLLTCEHCSYTTKYPNSLNRHCKLQHNLSPEETKDNTYKCEYENCEYVTYYRWNLNVHQRKHKLEKHHKCPKCDYRTAYRHNLLKHSKSHNEGVFFKCDKCPFVTKYEGHISRHLAKIHNEVSEGANRCDMCDFSTKIRWRLNTHKQRSRQSNNLKCEHCEFTTFYMCEHKKHKELHFGAIYVNKNTESSVSQPQPSLPLDIPKVESESQRDQYVIDPNCLDWNSIQVLESEDKERPFMCLMCSYTSKFKAAVQRHFQRHHTGTKNRPYKCCNCDFSTKTKDQIALHNKRSKSDKLLHCPICRFSTMFKCHLAMHQKTHYTFKCTMCSYSCRQKYDLKKHYAVAHMGKGLKCHFCDYVAARKESLLCHEAIHTGNKPFKCTLCNYSSVRRSLLDVHTRRFHCDRRPDVTIVSDDKIESLKVPLPELLNQLKEIESFQFPQ
ncbi:zinc finger protein 761-like isoform X1 [Pieris brassicae]|uniref:zinc finger protein 761-like isoform X1 n=2 Tax=Pieris brassicae TaxID=7116 RepID=UPI001E662207|nr:zinc finger protein 761-like isoform X1 [Pieris brassicae]XP_045529394.1 zinc finger protein 761-like isoform X1 [Pieris brassicae]XP_045529395.1 zinc finger protein 761-like isoform X1 [Pieris brassicae]